MKGKIFALIASVAICTMATASPPGQPKEEKAFVVEAPASSLKLEKLQLVYTAQIGVREATGKNDGVQVEKYLRSVNLGKGYAWCAAFVHWCLVQAGYTNSITAWSPTAHNSKNVIYAEQRWYGSPRPGDVGTLYYPRLKRIAHTFFWDGRLNDKIYRSVEGNTNGAGSREGDGVYRKYRSYRATHSITRWT